MGRKRKYTFEDIANNHIKFKPIFASELSAHATFVLCYLRLCENAAGQCWPSIHKICKDTKLSESSVRRALKELEAVEWIRVEPQYRENHSQSSNVYTIRREKPGEGVPA